MKLQRVRKSKLKHKTLRHLYKNRHQVIGDTKNGDGELKLYPYAPLALLAFLDFLQYSERIEVQGKEEKKWLQKRIINSVIEAEVGAVCCEACAARGIWNNERLEGHYVQPAKMKISEYKHCITLIRRRSALH